MLRYENGLRSCSLTIWSVLLVSLLLPPSCRSTPADDGAAPEPALAESPPPAEAGPSPDAVVQEPAPAPEPAPKPEYLMRDLLADRLAFEHSISIDVLKSRFDTNERPAWFDEAVAVSNDYLRQMISMPNRPVDRDIETRARGLLDEGCDDPFIAFIVGALSRYDDDWRASAELLDDAVARFESYGYGPLWTARAARLSAQTHQKTGWGDPRDDLRIAAVDALRETIRRGAFSSVPPRIVVHAFDEFIQDDELHADLSPLMEWIAGAPTDQLDPWAARVIAGRYEIKAAWEKRGSGYASTVTEEGWEGFHKHLEMAYNHLIAAHDMAPDRPEAAGDLITIAMATRLPDGQDEQYWFEQAINAQFDWNVAYSRILGALEPKWGGSFEDLWMFGTECAATERYDTDVPGVFIQALRLICKEQLRRLRRSGEHHRDHDAWAVLADDEVYALVRTIQKHVCERDLSTWEREYHLSVALALAWWGNQIDDAIALADRLGEERNWSAIRSVYAPPARVNGDVALWRGPAREFVIPARTAFADEEYDTAYALYEKALAVVAANSNDARIIAGRMGVIDQMKRFMAGETVDLTFNESLSGWREIGGAWLAVDDDELLNGATEGGGRLLCRTPFGRRWRLTGMVDVEHLESTAWRCARIFFLDLNLPGVTCFNVIDIFPHKDKARLGHTHVGRSDDLRKIPDPLGGGRYYGFALHLWDDQVVFEVNRKVIFSGPIPIDPEYDTGPFIGLGSSFKKGSGYVLWRELKIKRLTEAPEALRDAEKNSDPS
jgi:hypothetical protein